MKNIIHIISCAGLSLFIAVGVHVNSATAAPNKKCFNGSGNGTIGATRFNAKHEAHLQAVSNWNKKARVKLNSTLPNWHNSSNKKQKLINAGRYWRARVSGRFCLYVAAPVKAYKPKCAANDIKCKARNFRAIRTNKIPTPGVKQGLNPQPEPPSNSLRIR